MSLSRTASKRKLDDTETEPEGDTSTDMGYDNSQISIASSSIAAKKAKTSNDSRPGSTQPRNKVLPAQIQFSQQIPNTTRISTWNVCGLAASQKKGFKYYVEAEDADILVLTETKVNNIPMDLALRSRYPHQYWSMSEKKTYSGTAILSKVEPLSVTYTLPGHPNPSLVKGRIITLEFENSYLIGTYVVNAGEKLKTMDAKKEWNRHFDAYIRDLDQKKPVIWTGDINVAPNEKDLTNAKRNWNKTAGYTEPETTAFKNILSSLDDPNANKFVDVWRQLHPNDQHYTYWSYRFNCREKGIGWRLDMFVLSDRIVDRVKLCEIRDEIYGASDHCPLVMEIDGAL